MIIISELIIKLITLIIIFSSDNRDNTNNDNKENSIENNDSIDNDYIDNGNCRN